MKTPKHCPCGAEFGTGKNCETCHWAAEAQDTLSAVADAVIAYADPPETRPDCSDAIVKIGYDAYCISYGINEPPWSQLPPHIQNAWRAAVEAIHADIFGH